MKITAIIIKPRQADQVTVRVDGKTVATLPVDAVNNLGLHVDQNWDDRLAEKVNDAAACDRAMRDAMTRLNRRAYSTSQIREKLRGLGHEQAVVEQTIERLTRSGALNDAALGEILIRELNRRSPAGPKLIKVKLQERGFDSQTIDKLLEKTNTSYDEQIAAATELAQRKMKTFSSRVDAATRKRRLWGLLARRGFATDTIEAAIAAVENL